MHPLSFLFSFFVRRYVRLDVVTWQMPYSRKWTERKFLCCSALNEYKIEQDACDMFANSCGYTHICVMCLYVCFSFKLNASSILVKTLNNLCPFDFGCFPAVVDDIKINSIKWSKINRNKFTIQREKQHKTIKEMEIDLLLYPFSSHTSEIRWILLKSIKTFFVSSKAIAQEKTNSK